MTKFLFVAKYLVHGPRGVEIKMLQIFKSNVRCNVGMGKFVWKRDDCG